MGTMHPREGQIRIPPSSSSKSDRQRGARGPAGRARVLLGSFVATMPTRRFTRPTSRATPALVLLGLVLAQVAPPASRAARASDDLFGRDKALHFAASAGIALGGYGGTALFTEQRPPRLLVGGGLALFAGIAKEIADHYTGGDPSWRDLGWDLVGTATGLTLAYTIDWGWRRLRR